MKIKNIIFGVAIFLLTLSVGIYGVNTFYGSEPKWDDYCPNILSETLCIEKGGSWNNFQYNDRIEDRNSDGLKPVPAEGYCDIGKKCNDDYQSAREKYSRGLFYIALPLGIVLLGVGALIFGLEFVGAGVMFGGVGIIFYGVSRFWEFAEDWFKFVLSLVGLIIVILIAYILNRNLNLNKIFSRLGRGKD